MFNGLLQDWITISGTGTTPVKQTSVAWADLDSFSGVTFWLEVRDAFVDIGGTVIVLVHASCQTCSQTQRIPTVGVLNPEVLETLTGPGEGA